MSVLALGEYIGRTSQRWSAESLGLSVVVHDRQRINAEHAHEAAFVTLMLDGQYRETSARRSFGFDRFTALYHPPGIEHQDAIGEPGSRLLIFEFASELLDGIEEKRAELRSIRDLSGSLAAWKMLALYRETAVDCDSLQFESQAMQLIARLAPLMREIRRDLRSLERAREYLHANFRRPITMKCVATVAGVHPVYLGQAFHRTYGETVGNYVTRLRVRAAAEQLSVTETPLAAIAYEYGFCDQSHFQRTFKKLSGLTPAAFRRTFSAISCSA